MNKNKCYNPSPILNSIFDIDINNINADLAEKIRKQAPEDYFIRVHNILTQFQPLQVARCKICDRNIYKTYVTIPPHYESFEVWEHGRY